jgi:hypothetical protein
MIDDESRSARRERRGSYIYPSSPPPALRALRPFFATAESHVGGQPLLDPSTSLFCAPPPGSSIPSRLLLARARDVTGLPIGQASRDAISEMEHYSRGGMTSQSLTAEGVPPVVCRLHRLPSMANWASCRFSGMARYPNCSNIIVVPYCSR